MVLITKKTRPENGFSLLELMIAMFILTILLSIAIPTYNRSIQHARQVVLGENLWQMRRAIDQYRSDKGRLPDSIETLVQGQYLRETPKDPITENTEWDEIQGEDSLDPEKEQGMVDVKSLAEGKDLDGKDYKDY